MPTEELSLCVRLFVHLPIVRSPPLTPRTESPLAFLLIPPFPGLPTEMAASRCLLSDHVSPHFREKKTEDLSLCLHFFLCLLESLLSSPCSFSPSPTYPLHIPYTGWQSTAHRPNPACFLFLSINFYWDTAKRIYLHIANVWFCATNSELSGCGKDCMTQQAKNIPYFVL